MNTVANQAGPDRLRPNLRINYWRLWLWNTALVSAGLLFFLASQYGTREFFAAACLMALLPLIPLLVLVGGAGSTLFVLTKVMIEKRSLRAPAALGLLVGPGLGLTLALVLLGAGRPAGHRLAYICLGNAPASASQVQVAGYSTFLREEWLAVFKVGQQDFQTMVAGAQMAPVDNFEFRQMFEQSSLKHHPLFPGQSRLNDLPCFKRVFKEQEERKRGTVYAVFDPASSTAVVFREYRD